MKNRDVVRLRAVCCILLAALYMVGFGILLTTPFDLDDPAIAYSFGDLDGGYPYAYYAYRDHPYWVDMRACSGRTPEQAVEALRNFPTEDVARILLIRASNKGVIFANPAHDITDIDSVPPELLDQLYGAYFGQAADTMTPLYKVELDDMINKIGRDEHTARSLADFYYLLLYDSNDMLMCVILPCWYEGWIWDMPLAEYDLMRELFFTLEEYGAESRESYSYYILDDEFSGILAATYFILTAVLSAVLCACGLLRRERGLEAVPFLSAHERMPRRASLACFAHLYGQPYAGRN